MNGLRPAHNLVLSSRLWWTALPALGMLLVWAVLWWPFLLDDAYISFQYARNLGAGLGPVFNPGERVEGFSSPAWVAVLALAGRAGIPEPLAARVLDVTAAVLLVLQLYRALLRSGCDRRIAGAACLVLASLPSLHSYLASGMETLPYALALFVVVTLAAAEPGPAKEAGLGLALIAVATLRPEGPILAAGLSVAVLLESRTRSRWITLGAVWAVLVALLLARYEYYGAWVSNTAAVKSPPFLRLVEAGDARSFLAASARAFRRNFLPAGAELGGLLLPLFTVLALRGLMRDAARVRALQILAGGAVIVALKPADWMPGARFALPYYPAALFLMALGVQRLWADAAAARPPFRWALNVALGSTLAVALGLATGTSFERLLGHHRGMSDPPLRAQQQYLTIGRWLADRASTGESVLAYEVGALGYGSRLPVLDHEGLLHAEIAQVIRRAGEYGAVRTGRDPVAMSRVVAICAEQRPDWFLVRSRSGRELRVGEPVPSEAAVEPIQRAMLEAFGTSMTLAAVFPLVADTASADCYLMLERSR
ncbi:MAG: hypothetical protein ACREOU_11940 [Candidatus Eiseniibacteriota bacterium]